jgi:hypothetical protein
MNTSQQATLARRSLLKATGALGLAAAGGLALPGGPAASAASAQLSVASYSHTLYTGKALTENRTQQAFAFDQANRRFFVLQGRQDNTGDDLCLNRVSLSGTPLGTMYLDNVGHGVGFGVESVGTDSYIWSEARADSTGRATCLMRFKWIPGTKPANVQYYFEGRGYRDVSCSMDPLNQHLVVRYIPAGSTTSSHVNDLYSLPFGHPDQMRFLLKFALPGTLAGIGVMQGSVPYGQYFYVLLGSPQRDVADIDSKLAVVDMYTSKQVGSAVTTYAGKNLPFREPEGIGIYRSLAGTVGLYFGFTSRNFYDGRLVYSNIFYKNHLV